MEIEFSLTISTPQWRCSYKECPGKRGKKGSVKSLAKSIHCGTTLFRE
jgi:hypothetical protein